MTLASYAAIRNLPRPLTS